MSTSLDNTLIRPGSCYTGTPNQPDSVSLFYKQSDGTIKIKDEEIINSLGHSPSERISALPRINNAAKQILKECRLGICRADSELLNAVKNLMRGFVQLVPVLGNRALYLFDYVRTNIFFHSTIKMALRQQNGPVLGIAFDGKIVSQFSPDQFQTALGGTPFSNDDPLPLFMYMWTNALVRSYERGSTPPKLEIAQKLTNEIINRTLLD